MKRLRRLARGHGFGLLLLAGCSSQPPAPAWSLQAHSALERYRQAYLAAADGPADTQFEQARAALTATGQATLVARAHLVRRAVQAASLEWAPCEAFEALRPDVAAPERAYAQYLAGLALAPHEAALLPAAHRGAPLDDQALARIDDPLSRLVAAGVMVRAGRATPATLQVAVATASAQGWRRPLLAWLGAQALRAEHAGDAERAQRLRRRIALVISGGG